MGMKTVILDCIMFISYIANIFFGCLQFVKIAQGLNEEETIKLYHKRYSNKLLNCLYITIGFLLVGIVATLLDGISGFNEETMRIAMPVALLAFIYSNAFFIICKVRFTKAYKKKLNRNNMIIGWGNATDFIVHIITAFAFAVHTGLLAYTIALWVV